MSAMKRHLEDMGELAMMGKYVPVQSNAEAEAVANYIIAVIGSPNQQIDNIEKLVNAYWDNNPKHLNKITHVGSNRIMDMPVITFLLDNDADEDDEWAFIPYDEKTYPYRFSYNLNLAVSDFSELGDVCVLPQMDGYLHRVG